jgi:hypothetical protein
VAERGSAARSTSHCAVPIDVGNTVHTTTPRTPSTSTGRSRRRSARGDRHQNHHAGQDVGCGDGGDEPPRVEARTEDPSRDHRLGQAERRTLGCAGTKPRRAGRRSVPGIQASMTKGPDDCRPSPLLRRRRRLEAGPSGRA